MTTAPRGAAIVYLVDRRLQRALLTRQDSPNQLARGRDGFKAYRRTLDAWDETGGKGDMPQPTDVGLNLPDLRPSQVHWGAAS